MNLEARRVPAVGEGLDETLVALGKARHAPGYIYASPEIHQLDKDKIFMREWLCMARAEEIAAPGDYMTFRVMDEPLHPVIAGLFAVLPPAGSNWPEAERVKWLATAQAAIEMVYSHPAEQNTEETRMAEERT